MYNQLKDLGEDSTLIDKAKLEEELLKIYKPVNLNGKDSEEIKMERAFMDSVCSLSKELHINAMELSTVRFYLALDYLDRYIELTNKAYKKR